MHREVSPEAWVAKAEICEEKQSPELIDHLENPWKYILQVNQSPTVAARRLLSATSHHCS
jgi:hypothetical protein